MIEWSLDAFAGVRVGARDRRRGRRPDRVASRTSPAMPRAAPAGRPSVVAGGATRAAVGGHRAGSVSRRSWSRSTTPPGRCSPPSSSMRLVGRPRRRPRGRRRDRRRPGRRHDQARRGRSDELHPAPRRVRNAGLVVEATEDRVAALGGADAAGLPTSTRCARPSPSAPSGRDAATDEAMLVEAAGGTVLLHPRGAENLKVTTPRDLRLAELLLGSDRARRGPEHAQSRSSRCSQTSDRRRSRPGRRRARRRG